MPWSTKIHDEIQDMFSQLIVFDGSDMKAAGMGLSTGHVEMSLEDIQQKRVAAGKKAADSPNHYSKNGFKEQAVIAGLIGASKRTGRSIEDMIKARNTAFILALQGLSLNEIRRRTKVGYDEVRRIMLKAGRQIAPPGGASLKKEKANV